MGPKHPETLPPSLLFKHPSQREKNLFLFFCKGDFNICAFTSILQPYLFPLYFNVFVFRNYSMSIYIFFCLIIILLFLWVYKVYLCILALSNSTAELSSLSPCLEFGLWQTKQEQKHWVTKCYLEVFLNVVFINHFHIVAIVTSFLFCYCLFFSDVTHDQLLSVNAKLSVGNP